MTAPDARNDAVQFLYKHGEMTYSAAASAIAKLCNNGFHITRPTPLAEARTALARDDVAGWIGSLPKAPIAEALTVPTEDDREWIDARADELLRQSERRRGSIRPQMTTPQDLRDYFVVNATLERFAALRAIGERTE